MSPQSHAALTHVLANTYDGKRVPMAPASVHQATRPEADLAVRMDHVFGSLQDIAAQAGQLRAVHAEARRYGAWRRVSG